MKGGGKLITLDKARDKAVKLTDKDIPATLSLHNWKNAGLISKRSDFKIDSETGGKSGLYPDYIVLEIAIAAELKKNYKIDEIAAARAKFMKLFQERLNKGERLSATSEEIGRKRKENEYILKDNTGSTLIFMKMADKENELMAKATKTNDPAVRANLLQEVNELATQRQLTQAYINQWLELELKENEIYGGD